MGLMAYAWFDHEADIGVIGTGATVEEALVAAAQATFALMVDPAQVAPVLERSFAFDEADLELALVTWLNLLIGEGLAFCRFALRRDGADWLGHPVAGASWEGFALEQVLALHPGQDATFYRTAAGAELDLVLGPDGKRQAFEFKMGLAPTVTRGFWEGTKDLAVSRAQIVFPGEGRYPLAPGGEVAGPCDVVAAMAQPAVV